MREFNFSCRRTLKLVGVLIDLGIISGTLSNRVEFSWDPDHNIEWIVYKYTIE